MLFLAVGAILGAAVGYVAASDKKEQWLNDIGGLVNKIKGNIKPSQGGTIGHHNSDNVE